MRSLLTRNSVFFAALVALAVFAFVVQAPALADPWAGPLLFGMAAAAPAANRPTVNWGRKREPMKPFYNTGVSATAVAEIPRYPRTILGLILQLGGTTFAKSDISRVEVFLGEKSIWGPVSGTELDDVARYIDNEERSDYFLPIDFASKSIKEIGGEQIGGLDLTTLPDGKLRLEVEIGAAAVAPALTGHIVWSAPQGGGAAGGLMLKLVKRVYPNMAAGDQYPGVDLRGAILLRQFFRYTVANAGVSAVAGSGVAFANTGNGVMGAITVTARTPTGRYRLRVVEPGTNVGTFVVYDPEGREIGAGVVAVAFAGGGLAFTLADGSTDFVAGDGFTIDVLPLNTDGNLNLVEIKKNEDVWWSRTCRAARFEQKRFGRQPLSQMYVADFVADNHIDSVIDTANAVALDYRVNLTAADTLTVIHQMLARPVL